MTSDIELTSQFWPFDASEMDAKQIKFKPITATIDFVYRSDRGPSYRFKEDTTEETGKDGKAYTGCLWRLKGMWDETRKVFDRADDLGFDKGDVVEVRLSMRKGQTSFYRDCLSIRTAPGTAPKQAPGASQSGGATGVGARHPRDETRVSIERQQVLIKCGDKLAAKIAIGMPVEDYAADETRFDRMCAEFWPEMFPEFAPSVAGGETESIGKETSDAQVDA